MTTVADLLVRELSVASYGASIRAAVRGLWRGDIDQSAFIDTMLSAINRGLEQAWREGARECGIGPDERTTQEEAALVQLQNRSIASVQSFGIAISQATRADGALLRPHLNRAASWTNRYNEARNLARSMACADQKFTWVLGPTEHCSSCLKMAGKVKRASQWDAREIRPQHPDLECGGWRCQCQLQQTDAPLSRGPLPGLP